jgi:hypothetical protein
VGLIYRHVVRRTGSATSCGNGIVLGIHGLNRMDGWIRCTVAKCWHFSPPLCYFSAVGRRIRDWLSFICISRSTRYPCIRIAQVYSHVHVVMYVMFGVDTTASYVTELLSPLSMRMNTCVLLLGGNYAPQNPTHMPRFTLVYWELHLHRNPEAFQPSNVLSLSDSGNDDGDGDIILDILIFQYLAHQTPRSLLSLTVTQRVSTLRAIMCML